MISLSIVLPTFNEEKSGYLDLILKSCRDLPGAELIAVDGGSDDGTLDKLEEAASRVLVARNTSRAQRLNLGFDRAQGSMVLFHHPRSVIDRDGLRALVQLAPQAIWGGFTHGFDHEHPLLSFTSWYSNCVRCDRRGILYLDHCIFFHKKLVRKKPAMPELDIFEDTAFSLLLRQNGHPLRLPYRAQTSAIRFKSNGVWQQALLNQVLKVGYHCRLPHRYINWIYEKGLELNSKVRF